MRGAGAILDIPLGMKPVQRTVDARFPVFGRESEAVAQGRISVDTEKFPLHILVVDDEPLIRWSVVESLADSGADVEEASDAATTLRMITTTALPFDVVVLDLRLPDMDDLALLDTIRQLLPSARLVLMTAFGTPEILADAQALGATVLNKPFELDELKRLALGSSLD